MSNTEGGGTPEFDPELDGREGKRQSDRETQRLTKDGVNAFMRKCATMIKDGSYGRLTLIVDFADGQVQDTATIEKVTGKRTNGVDVNSENQ